MSMPAQIVLDKEKILSQVQDLAHIAQKNNWVLDYDSDIDELVFGKDYMPRDSFLFNVNDELNLFLTPRSEVTGVHIEYFKANFLAHNKKLTPVLPVIEKKVRPGARYSANAKRALEVELAANTFTSLFSKDALVTVL